MGRRNKPCRCALCAAGFTEDQQAAVSWMVAMGYAAGWQTGTGCSPEEIQAPTNNDVAGAVLAGWAAYLDETHGVPMVPESAEVAQHRTRG